MIHSVCNDARINTLYQELFVQYFDPKMVASETPKKEKNDKSSSRLLNPVVEKKLVDKFLATRCSCGRDCQQLFSANELLTARSEFNTLTSQEKNCYILAQLRLLSRNNKYASSARIKSIRQRQKFDYKINSDRVICRDTFLFYYGETIKRLTRLQGSLSGHIVLPPVHGNTGKIPSNAYSAHDRELVKMFITNLSEAHGLPDPGRDVRQGKGRLRILLPSVMSYTSIHELYENSLIGMSSTAIGYQTFLKIWQEEFPHIEFNNPKTDLCMLCENFKKDINQLASSLEANREELKFSLYKNAVEHLDYARKERLYYNAHTQIAKIDYERIISNDNELALSQPNSRDIVMGYSWDFAQQLQYPFEDQQVGPIYFKIPRRAQLFGVCCEGNFQQTNYLIDEADALGKNANTVISLLDHYFSNYGLGERTAYFTADNCVGQNKNNALIQYLMYRVLSGLHQKIELSFLAVGHTKFSPDSHFGLIRQRYRNSKIYTFEHLVKTIEQSTDGYNSCHSNTQNTKIIYRDWTAWLTMYFKPIPNITSYQHFRFDAENDEIIIKKTIDTEEKKINLAKGKNIIDFKKNRLYPEKILEPMGLSAERQWYLYEHIREHIVTKEDKNSTCPKPACPKPKVD